MSTYISDLWMSHVVVLVSLYLNSKLYFFCARVCACYAINHLKIWILIDIVHYWHPWVECIKCPGLPGDIIAFPFLQIRSAFFLLGCFILQDIRHICWQGWRGKAHQGPYWNVHVRSCSWKWYRTWRQGFWCLFSPEFCIFTWFCFLWLMLSRGILTKVISYNLGHCGTFHWLLRDMLTTIVLSTSFQL